MRTFTALEVAAMSRWRAAIHEASHCIAAIVLGGRCDCITVCSDSSGLAHIRYLTPFDHAVAVAAASAAEDLLGDEPSPEPGPKPRTITGREACDVSPSVDLAVLASRLPRDEAVSDERAIALFCVSGVEDEPTRWADRYYFVHSTAHRVVADHTRQILTVARELFLRGVLHQHEISQIIGAET
jgi:hypothetical protein